MKTFPLLLISFAVSLCLNAQTLILRYANNSEIEIEINNVQKITYATDSFYLHQVNSPTLAFPLSGVVLKYNISTPLTDQKENLLQVVKLAPNPVIDELTFMLPELSQDLTVKIFDLAGQVIYDNKYINPSSKLTVSVHDLEIGMYFCVIQSGNSIITKVFIKN